MASPFYDNYNAVIDRGRKDRAYEALRSVYGDIAGDPETARELQRYGERERIAPGEWEAQQQALEIGRQQIGQGRQAEADAATQRRRTALLNGAQYVVSAMDRAKDAGASEGSIMDAAIVAFNRVAPNLGMSEEEIQQTRDALASDPNSARDTVAMLLGNDARAKANTPAKLQEWEAYSKLSPQQRELYDNMNRGQQWRVVDVNGVPTVVQPGVPSGGAAPVPAPRAQPYQGGGSPQPAGRGGPGVTPLSTVDAEAEAKRRLAESAATGTAAGKGFFEAVDKQRTEAESAQVGLAALDEAEKALTAGITTGFSPQTRNLIGRAFTTLTGKPSPQTENTDVYLATIGGQVAQNIRAFGAGTGLSDADREFAERMAGGDIQASPDALRRILAINRKAAQGVIRRYREGRERFLKRNPDMKDMLPDYSERGQGAQQFENGKIYEDANGNRARFNNGGWETVE